MTSSAGIEAYLRATIEAEKDGIDRHRHFVSLLDDLDALFRQLFLDRVQREFGTHQILAMNAHANFLAAAAAAFRGQAPQTFMILRGALESACYAYLISIAKDEGSIWLDRKDHLEQAKRLFNVNRACQKLEDRDQNLAVMVKDTYQWMIEFGAHPNPRSIIEHLRFKEALEDGGVPLSFVYVQSADSLATMRCISACIENSCMILAVLCHTYEMDSVAGIVFRRAMEIWQNVQRQITELGYVKIEDA